MTTFEHDGYVPDPFGISQPVNQIVAQVGDTNPNFQPELTMLGDANSANLTVLDWTMNEWSGTPVAFRILWLFAGAGLAALGALPFDRFNPANARSHQPNRLERWWQRQLGTTSENGRCFSPRTQQTHSVDPKQNCFSLRCSAPG